MRRAGPVVVAASLFLYLALVPQACSDQTSSTVAPDTEVSGARGGDGKATLPEGAASEARINRLIDALFPQPEKQQAHRLFAQIKSALDDGDTEAARDLMFELLDLLLTTDLNEPGDITRAEATAQFSDLLFEFVGLQAPDVDPQLIQDIEDGTVDGVVAVIEGDRDNTIITPGTENPDGETGNTGLFVPDGALPDDQDYLLVVRELPVPCANTIFEQLPFCYEYETFPSPAVFNPGTEGIVAVCVDLDLPQAFASLIQDSDGVVAELPEADPTAVTGFTCEPRNIADAGSSNPIVRLARALFRPVTHVFDPPYLVAINVEGMAGSIGSIDTRYVGTVPKVIAEVSGDGQTGTPGSTLPSPFVVEVVHAHDGTPAAGVPVTFAVTGGGGSLSAGLDITDVDGEASTTLTLGGSVGTTTVEASAPQTNLTGDPADPAGPVTFTAEAAGVVVDGVKSSGEWDDAASFAVFTNDADLDGSNLYVMNDASNLYLALEVTDPLTSSDIWELRFDDADNDTLDAGDDALSFSQTAGFRDEHFNGTVWGVLDAVSHGTAAAGSPTAGTAFFEISHPLNSGDGEDVALTSGDVFGLCIRFFDDGGSASASTDVYPPDCVLAVNDQNLYEDITVTP